MANPPTPATRQPPIRLPALPRPTARLLDALGIGHAIIFGWSLGGHVAMELASFHHAVSGLVLTGAPPVSRGPLGMLRGFHANWDMLLASKKVYSERDIERFEALCFGDTASPSFREAIRRTDGRLRAGVARSMFAGKGADQKQVVEHAPFPVAVINGEHDPLVRLSYFETVAYGSLWEQCHVIPGAGHAPFWERPDLFNPSAVALCRDGGEAECSQARAPHARPAEIFPTVSDPGSLPRSA